jgi:hypothetical protein
MELPLILVLVTAIMTNAHDNRPSIPTHSTILSLQSAQPEAFPMDLTESLDVLPTASNVISQIKREALLLRGQRKVMASPPKPPNSPPMPSPSPILRRKPPKSSKPPKPLIIIKKKFMPPSPSPHRHYHYVDGPPLILPPEEPPSGIVVWNAGPPLCGVSSTTCNSKILRTSCWVTESSIANGQEIDVGGFVSKLGSLRDKRTLSTEGAFSCDEISLKDFRRDHSIGNISEVTRQMDEVEHSKNVDTLNYADQMYTGLSMFRRDKGGMPICGTIDLVSNYVGGSGKNHVVSTATGNYVGGNGQYIGKMGSNSKSSECTNVLFTSCDHTISSDDPNGEHRLVVHDTLVLNTSITTRALGCSPEIIQHKKKEYYINIETKRKITFGNNTMITIRGDLFNKKKNILRGQFDFIYKSKTIHTTLDLRDDINVGDLIGLRLPGISITFESVIVSRPNEFTLIMGTPFKGSASLLGYSGHLVYVRRALSGRLLGTEMGQGMYIKKPHVFKDTKRTKKEEESLSLSSSSSPLSSNTMKLKVNNELEAKAICNDIKGQYHSIIRLYGSSIFKITNINGKINLHNKYSITVDQKYCNDIFLGVKLYRGLIKREKPIKIPKHYGNATELPGRVAVGNGSFIAVTTHDLSSLVMSGDRVQIADQQCVVEDCRSAMLTLKCNTQSGAWMSWYTGVNYHIYLLPPRQYHHNVEDIKNTCLSDLKSLTYEKMKCKTLPCILRLQAMECAVHSDCFSRIGSSWKSLSKNLNCNNENSNGDNDPTSKKSKIQTNVIPRSARIKDDGKDGDKWGFFTRI